MTQQQEMWIRSNMARRQAMMAAVARMRYSAAGGASGSQAAKDEGIVVPPIPMRESSYITFADGTVSAMTDLMDLPSEEFLDKTVKLEYGEDQLSA